MFIYWFIILRYLLKMCITGLTRRKNDDCHFLCTKVTTNKAVTQCEVGTM